MIFRIGALRILALKKELEIDNFLGKNVPLCNAQYSNVCIYSNTCSTTRTPHLKSMYLVSIFKIPFHHQNLRRKMGSIADCQQNFGHKIGIFPGHKINSMKFYTLVAILGTSFVVWCLYRSYFYSEIDSTVLILEWGRS